MRTASALLSSCAPLRTPFDALPIESEGPFDGRSSQYAGSAATATIGMSINTVQTNCWRIGSHDSASTDASNAWRQGDEEREEDDERSTPVARPAAARDIEVPLSV